MAGKVTTRSLSSVGITWLIVQALWFFGLTCAVLSVIVVVIGLVGSSDAVFEIPLSASIDASHAGNPVISISGSETEAISLTRYEVPVLMGSLKDLPFGVRVLLCAGLAVVVTAFLFVLYHLRAIVSSVKGRQPFLEGNPERLRRIGYVIMVIGPALGLLRYAISSALLRGFELSATQFQPTLDLHPAIVVLGLLILLIANAFDVGIRLQRDSDLTV